MYSSIIHQSKKVKPQDTTVSFALLLFACALPSAALTRFDNKRSPRPYLNIPWISNSSPLTWIVPTLCALHTSYGHINTIPVIGCEELQEAAPCLLWCRRLEPYGWAASGALTPKWTCTPVIHHALFTGAPNSPQTQFLTGFTDVDVGSILHSQRLLDRNIVMLWWWEAEIRIVTASKWQIHNCILDYFDITLIK